MDEEEERRCHICEYEYGPHNTGPHNLCEGRFCDRIIDDHFDYSPYPMVEIVIFKKGN